MRLWQPVFCMMLVSLISYVDRNTLAVLAPTILKETGLSTLEYTRVVSFFSVAYMIGNPIWGLVLDRIGLRSGMTFSVGLWTLASAAHALMSGFWGFATARTVLGFGEGATFPGGLRTALQTLPPEKQSRGMAIAYSGGSLGAILTPLIVTPIAARFGWQGAFIFSGIIGLAWIALWRGMPIPPIEQPAESPKFDPKILMDWRLPALLCAYGLGALPLAFVLYAAPIYLNKMFQLDQGSLGKLLWIPPLGWEVGYFFWGWVADRLAHIKRPVLPMAVLAVASFLPIRSIAAGSPLEAAIWFAVGMFVAAGFIVFGLRYGASVYPTSNTGLVAGLAAGGWSLFVAIYIPQIGRLFDQGLYHQAITATAFVPLIGFLGWWVTSSLASQRTDRLSI